MNCATMPLHLECPGTGWDTIFIKPDHIAEMMEKVCRQFFLSGILLY